MGRVHIRKRCFLYLNTAIMYRDTVLTVRDNYRNRTMRVFAVSQLASTTPYHIYGREFTEMIPWFLALLLSRSSKGAGLASNSKCYGALVTPMTAQKSLFYLQTLKLN